MSGMLSSSELLISDSNKRPRSDDDCDWMNDLDTIEVAYNMLTSADFVTTMNRGNVVVKRLLSKEAELELGDKFIVRLKELTASFGDLLTSLTKTNDDDHREMLRLVHLAHHILEEWEGVENAIRQHKLSPVSCLLLAHVDDSQTVPSAWMFEYHWRDNAHKEVVSIRKKYSYFLDDAYCDSYASYVKKNDGVSGSIALSLKKHLNFLMSSREDFEFFYVEKCYKRVMSIKELCMDLSLRESENLTDQPKLPNCRDDIYDQVVALRKKYSLDLDKLFGDVYNKMKITTPDVASKELFSFLNEALQFMANGRDDIAIYQEEYCLEQLAAIKQRLVDLFPAKESATTPQCRNWRDLEYGALQIKAHRFMHEVQDVYLKYKTIWSKIPACNEAFRKLEYHMEAALHIYRMARAEMALIVVKEQYYDLCRQKLRNDVDECIALIRILLPYVEEAGTPPSWEAPHIFIPKAGKFVHQLWPLTVSQYYGRSS